MVIGCLKMLCLHIADCEIRNTDQTNNYYALYFVLINKKQIMILTSGCEFLSTGDKWQQFVLGV